MSKKTIDAPLLGAEVAEMFINGNISDAVQGIISQPTKARAAAMAVEAFMYLDAEKDRSLTASFHRALARAAGNLR